MRSIPGDVEIRWKRGRRLKMRLEEVSISVWSRNSKADGKQRRPSCVIDVVKARVFDAVKDKTDNGLMNIEATGQFE